MLGNDDNSIKINVNSGDKGMGKGTVTIEISEYKKILELSYKAAMLKDVMFNNSLLDYSGKELYFGAGCCNDADKILKYAFPNEYAARVRALKHEKEAETKRVVEQLEKATARLDEMQGANDER